MKKEKIYLGFLVSKKLADVLNMTVKKRYQSRSKLVVIQLLSEALKYGADLNA